MPPDTPNRNGNNGNGTEGWRTYQYFVLKQLEQFDKRIDDLSRCINETKDSVIGRLDDCKSRHNEESGTIKTDIAVLKTKITIYAGLIALGVSGLTQLIIHLLTK